MVKEKTAGVHISRRGMFVWIGLIVFIAGWMFVLGIMVGRGSAPVNLEVGKLEQELAQLKAKMLKREEAKVDAQVGGKGGDKPELGFYEELKSPSKKKDDAAFKTLPEVPPRVKPAPAPARQATRQKPASRPKPEPAPAVKPEPAPKPKPAPQPKPPAATAAQKGRFTIQVAAVQESKNAEQLVAELRKKGYRAYQIRSEVAGRGVWYRVRVGGFDNRDAANQMLSKLKGDRYGGMVVSSK